MWYFDKNGNLIIPRKYLESKKWVGNKGTDNKKYGRKKK